jgi:hypothetical protein
MNFYEMLGTLVDKASLPEGQQRDMHALLEVMKTMNAFGSTALQDVAAHTHEFQWDRIQGQRLCFHCKIPSADQTPPSQGSRRYW